MQAIIILIVVLVILAPLITLIPNFFHFFLIIAATILLIVTIKRNIEIRKRNLKGYSGKELIIQNVGKGGVIKIAHIDGQTDSLDLKVLNKHLYLEGDYSWFELECVNGNGEKFWLDIDDDDILKVSVVIKKLLRTELSFSDGLAVIDENERGYVKYCNEVYHYADSGDAVFYRNSDNTRKERLYYWDFQRGSYSISVEEWKNSNGKADKEYFLSQNIRPSTITVYSLGGEM